MRQGSEKGWKRYKKGSEKGSEKGVRKGVERGELRMKKGGKCEERVRKK